MKKDKFFFLWVGILTLIGLMFYVSCGGDRDEATISMDDIGFNETGFPIVSKPMTLTAIATKGQVTPDLNTLEVFKKFEAQTNIHIEFTYGGNETDWRTRKPLLLASGDLPDIFFGPCLLESDVIINRDLFVPLDDLIQQYGPNIQAFFNADPGIKRYGTAYDGKIWGLPRKNFFMPMTSTVWAINTKWLDNLGLSMPTTTEEFYEVLKAFKTRDPNGNGMPDEIPVSVLGNVNVRGGLLDFLGAFGVVESDNEEWLSVTDGRVQFIAAQDGFKDGTAYLNKLYSEGLIDQETFTQDRNALLAKTKQIEPEIWGMSAEWHRYGLLGYPSPRMDHIKVLPPLKGPKGHQAWRWNPEHVQGSKYAFEISKNCKYPEVAMRWIDNIYEPINSLQVMYGPIGSHIKDNGDGTYILVDRPGAPAFTGDWQNNFALASGPGANYAAFEDGRIDLQDVVVWNQREDKKTYIPYFPKEYYPDVSFSPEELDELVIFKQDIHTAAKEQFANWIVNGGVEQEYDDFVKRLYNIGLERMLEIYQTAYDRYMSVN